MLGELDRSGEIPLSNPEALYKCDCSWGQRLPSFLLDKQKDKWGPVMTSSLQPLFSLLSLFSVFQGLPQSKGKESLTNKLS